MNKPEIDFLNAMFVSMNIYTKGKLMPKEKPKQKGFSKKLAKQKSKRKRK